MSGRALKGGLANANLARRSLATAARAGLRRPNVGVAGATGAVGIEMRKKLLDRNFPVDNVRFFAHPSEEGTPLEFGGRTIACEAVNERSFDDLDICLFSAGGGFSKEWAPKAAAAGCIVVDNSSEFRMDPKCPLIVPEVNAHAVKGHKGIIANPNCPTMYAFPPLRADTDPTSARHVACSVHIREPNGRFLGGCARVRTA